MEPVFDKILTTFKPSDSIYLDYSKCWTCGQPKSGLQAECETCSLESEKAFERSHDES